MKIEDFNRAKEIRGDIKILKEQTINAGISKSTFNSWKEWVVGTIQKLEEEFKNL